MGICSGLRDVCQKLVLYLNNTLLLLETYFSNIGFSNNDCAFFTEKAFLQHAGIATYFMITLGSS